MLRPIVYYQALLAAGTTVTILATMSHSVISRCTAGVKRLLLLLLT